MADHAAPTRTWAVARSPEDLGRALNDRRVNLGWTQADLAEHLGFPVRYLHEIESGKHTLAYTRLFRLLATLGIDVRLHPATEEPETSVPTEHSPVSPDDVEWL